MDRTPIILSDVFRGFSQVRQENARVEPTMRPQSLNLYHYSLVSVPFDAL
jgi:hypothetical protein